MSEEHVYYQTKVHDTPEVPWVPILQPGHWVWLCKEQQEAMVEFPLLFHQPTATIMTPIFAARPRTPKGKIGLYVHRGNTRPLESWYMDALGRGLDGSQLVSPVSNRYQLWRDGRTDGEDMEIVKNGPITRDNVRAALMAARGSQW